MPVHLCTSGKPKETKRGNHLEFHYPLTRSAGILTPSVPLASLLCISDQWLRSDYRYPIIPCFSMGWKVRALTWPKVPFPAL